MILAVNEDGTNPMENPDLFGGDMLGIDFKGDRNAIPNDAQRWPGGVIYYEIDQSLSAHRDVITAAMNHISSKTCIRFSPATSGTRDYIHFFLGQGCYSNVGRTGGRQMLSLGNGCHYLRTAAHEMTHAIGFFHEQNRSDRDHYIRIHLENVQENMKSQFGLLQPSQNRLLTAFDFDGIMLYGPKAFSKNNGITMESITPGKRVADHNPNIGLSASDVYRINKLYGC